MPILSKISITLLFSLIVKLVVSCLSYILFELFPGTTSGLGDPATATNGAVVKTAEAPATPANFISDEDLMKFTEELFDKQDVNLNQYVELNLQKRASNLNNPDAAVPDEAPEP